MTLPQTSVHLPRKRPQRSLRGGEGGRSARNRDHLASAANAAICNEMGVESATEANECAHCYAFDAECIAFPPRAPPPSHRTATRQPRSDPPTASRRRVRCDHRKSPLTCGAFQGNVGDLEGRGRCEKGA